MKMAYEAMAIAFISMFFISIGISLLNINFIHTKALQISEYTIEMIEHYDGYTDEVNEKVSKKMEECRSCTLSIKQNGSQYLLKMVYTIPIPLINYTFKNQIELVSAT